MNKIAMAFNDIVSIQHNIKKRRFNKKGKINYLLSAYFYMKKEIKENNKKLKFDEMEPRWKTKFSIHLFYEIFIDYIFTLNFHKFYTLNIDY